MTQEKLNPNVITARSRGTHQQDCRVMKHFFLEFVNEAVIDACEWVPKQLFYGKHIMTKTSFRSACFALMLENNSDQKVLLKKQIYTSKSFGSKIFSLTQFELSTPLNVSGFAKDIFWGRTRFIGNNQNSSPK